MQQSKMGKGMLIVAWVIGLALLTYMFEEQLAEQFNPNEEPISSIRGDGVEVKLKQNKAGHYVTGGAINGQPVVFLLDTGATQVSIPMHLAKQLNLQQGRAYRVQTANGSVEVAQTNIERLSIGDIQLFDVDAHLNPAVSSNEILLGMSALKQLEFTQKGDWLILRHL
ncbi:TIGR02281 family clan AA aspartic protease [Paraglaciecola sp. 2405UD69-4]|uniref:retropepsin-like aspartic protease family protein n=1 Tax=Paraglaciecola sp. 2405UD69-4 TaxID=3391836 RepID=UPI0039C9C982